jgi:hypothetical protein
LHYYDKAVAGANNFPGLESWLRYQIDDEQKEFPILLIPNFCTRRYTMLHFKTLCLFCFTVLLFPSLLWAKYPADLKNIPAGDWSIERIDINSVVQRLADEVSTPTARNITFFTEGWDEASTDTKRITGTYHGLNFKIKRFPVDVRGKSLAETLDRITQADGRYLWSYDSRFGMVNLIDKRLINLPQWPLNKPLPESLKKENVSYVEMEKFLFNDLQYLKEDSKWLKKDNWIKLLEWSPGETKSLKPNGVKLETLRDLICYLLSQKKAGERGDNYVAIFNIRPPEVALERLRRTGMIDGNWYINAYHAYYWVDSLVEVMRYYDAATYAEQTIPSLESWLRYQIDDDDVTGEYDPV